MDEFTTIVLLRHKVQVIEKALETYRRTFNDMIFDPRVNNSLKGHFSNKVNSVEKELADLDELEQEVNEKGLYKTKWGKRLINKTNNNPA